MIAYLRGEVLHQDTNYLILKLDSIGYKVFVNENTVSAAKPGQAIELFIYEQVSDSGKAFFGFKTLEELKLFELLISVSGIGPRSGLAILNLAAPEDLRQAIAMQDYAVLTRVSGVGKKTAERLVLELKSKVGALPEVPGGDQNTKSDEIEALVNLGYSLSQARDALNKVSQDIKDSGDRIKEALKHL